MWFDSRLDPPIDASGVGKRVVAQIHTGTRLATDTLITGLGGEFNAVPVIDDRTMIDVYFECTGATSLKVHITAACHSFQRGIHGPRQHLALECQSPPDGGEARLPPLFVQGHCRSLHS